ncbi:hypothetical protein M441DRAFT_253872 [Trichoderma asperellum CBS 433.97]|uniref:Uncharacterized protein n=1 Tax=Trichoderma asperellum (strain ATCC 204424 / CBS 433.97 / NBRC 101777) TaxID=1042311 RepID=A0A2T3YYC1_TRIA4|nr:hypothetical protein M441DRAFT_253872 [Trichoderma asperellum CBS 433.97]PTB37561.1 hypothetical protein M441DRAFT_253872 [Trichoderma asperellum CBS 433.97]
MLTRWRHNSTWATECKVPPISTSRGLLSCLASIFWELQLIISNAAHENYYKFVNCGSCIYCYIMSLDSSL